MPPHRATYPEAASPPPQMPSERADLVERLRLLPLLQPLALHAPEIAALASEAAAEIERLRQGQAADSEQAEPPSIDWQSQEIVRDGVRVGLTEQEWLIFARLVKSAGKLVTRDELLDEIYWRDPSGGAAPKIIDVYLCKLRKKSPWPITTV